MTTVTEPVPPETPQADLDAWLSRAQVILGLAVLVAEVVWLLDTRAGTRPSSVLTYVRARGADLRSWWRRGPGAALTAADEAPNLWWEAWMAMTDGAS